MYVSILSPEAARVSPGTVAELVSTLQYLKREFDRGFRIDEINMRYVDKALALVDQELAPRRDYLGEQISALASGGTLSQAAE